MALDAHAAAQQANGARDRRGRIEHIETHAPADAPRFASLGVIASMQPLHANPDQNLMEVWAKNAGPDRASRGFAWGTLERAGARLVFGSDWPVVTSDVRRGLYCAVTRKTREGTLWADGGPSRRSAWRTRQALHDRRCLRFIRGRREGLAHAGQARRPRVLGDDIFRLPPESIPTSTGRHDRGGRPVVYRSE
jgi:hypothetical protein